MLSILTKVIKRISPQWPRKVFSISDSESKLNDIDDNPGKAAHSKEGDEEGEKASKLFVSPLSEKHFLAGQPKIFA